MPFFDLNLTLGFESGVILFGNLFQCVCNASEAELDFGQI